MSEELRAALGKIASGCTVNSTDAANETVKWMQGIASAALRASTDAAAVGGVAVRLGPCQHRWSHAPTVGYYQCIDCGERHDHGTTIYEQLKQMPAHPPADAAAVAGEDVAANEGRRRLFMRALAGLNLNENPVTVLGYAMAMGDQEDCYLADYIEDAPKYIDHLSDLGYRITRTDEASTDGETLNKIADIIGQCCSAPALRTEELKTAHRLDQLTAAQRIIDLFKDQPQ
jgi:hypothetical protein